jgi:hypothetical protein
MCVYVYVYMRLSLSLSSLSLSLSLSPYPSLPLSLCDANCALHISQEYSNWPTYPQLYIGGKLVGGLDVCTELAEEGELQEMLPAK